MSSTAVNGLNTFTVLLSGFYILAPIVSICILVRSSLYSIALVTEIRLMEEL